MRIHGVHLFSLVAHLVLTLYIVGAESIELPTTHSLTNKHECNAHVCSPELENAFDIQDSGSHSTIATSFIMSVTTSTSFISSVSTEVVATSVEVTVLPTSEIMFADINFDMDMHNKIESGNFNDTLEVEEDSTNSSNKTDSYKPSQNYTNTHANHSNETIDECHFLSFEEWKRQKVSDSKPVNDSQPQPEVESTDLVSTSNNVNGTEQNIHTEEDQGQTYKERFNYASVDCAATIVKTNSHAKGASAILVENKDSYLLNQCLSPQKFVVIELCQDILVDTVVVGNFEFFSSTFRKLRISVSDRFPVSSPTGWKTLGEFEAENIRDVQSFMIHSPQIWARYLKLEVLSHYGNEFYCPISLVRVYGKTMIEEFKMAEEHDSFVSGGSEIKGEDLLINNSMKDISNFTVNLENEECRVSLPHLGLNEFLEDINSTSSEYCDAMFPMINEPEAAQPIETRTTQESIYKNIMKRISLLESNASLSLLYIEEQSKLLSTAFSKLEKRQSSNFESLINSFNDTMHNQLAYFKKAYLNIQAEASKLFKAQEYSHQHLLEESNQKIIMLSNQIRFQRKISIFNTIIIICILAYVALTRDVYIEDQDNGFENEMHISRRPSRYQVLLERYKKNNLKRNQKWKKKRNRFT